MSTTPERWDVLPANSLQVLRYTAAQAFHQRGCNCNAAFCHRLRCWGIPWQQHQQDLISNPQNQQRAPFLSPLPASTASCQISLHLLPHH